MLEALSKPDEPHEDRMRVLVGIVRTIPTFTGDIIHAIK